MTWSGVDSVQHPIRIVHYDPQRIYIYSLIWLYIAYYYSDQKGDILLSSENCESIEKAIKEKYPSINITNNSITYDIRIDEMSITRSDVHLTYPLMKCI